MRAAAAAAHARPRTTRQPAAQRGARPRSVRSAAAAVRSCMRSGTHNAAALVHSCWRRHNVGLLLRGRRASAVSQRHVHRAALRNAMADGSLAPPPLLVVAAGASSRARSTSSAHSPRGVPPPPPSRAAALPRARALPCSESADGGRGGGFRAAGTAGGACSSNGARGAR